MTPELWGALGVSLTALFGYLGYRMQVPKIMAEARKAEAEAISLDWTRLHAEIDRLDLKIKDQDAKIEALLGRIAEQENDRRAVALVADEREQENKSLRAKLTRLEKRLSAIEALFKAHPLTPEFLADLDRLNKEH